MSSDLILILQFWKVERREIIVENFHTVNLLDRTVFFQQRFGTTQFSIVLKSHGVNVSSPIVDDKKSPISIYGSA